MQSTCSGMDVKQKLLIGMLTSYRRVHKLGMVLHSCFITYMELHP